MQTWYNALVGLPTHNLIINSQLATQSKKKSSLVSGNRPSENFFIVNPPVLSYVY